MAGMVPERGCSDGPSRRAMGGVGTLTISGLHPHLARTAYIRAGALGGIVNGWRCPANAGEHTWQQCPARPTGRTMGQHTRWHAAAARVPAARAEPAAASAPTRAEPAARPPLPRTAWDAGQSSAPTCPLARRPAALPRLLLPAGSPAGGPALPAARPAARGLPSPQGT